ncbi:MAG: 30S ribosomal protein S20 [Candidatus Paceibacterota bacterium]|jgi:small subunit ribosomal protein S20
MPITKTAKRALKKSLKRREKNLLQRAILKKTEKKFLKLLVSSNLEQSEAGFDIEEAKKILTILYKLLDKAAKTNLIKKNKANRDKSRLAKKLSDRLKTAKPKK